MKKVIFILALAMALALSGCTEEVTVTAPTYTAPTLPDFDQSLSPEEHLFAAMDQLYALDSFTVTYGSGWKDKLTLTTGSGEDTFAALRELVPNEDFISHFSAGSMTVSPSNTGSFLYQSGSLTAEEVCKLICNRSLTEQELAALENYTEVTGQIRIGLDADRCFQLLEVDLTLGDAHWLLQIQIKEIT